MSDPTLNSDAAWCRKMVRTRRFDGNEKQRLERIAARLEAPIAEPPLRLEWREGLPPKPWSKEWFIALTTYGDRVVLRALPEEYTYDFKTADATYIKADKIAKWMQFPDSEYIAPAPIAEDALVEALDLTTMLLREMRETLNEGALIGPVSVIDNVLSKVAALQAIHEKKG